MLHPGAQHFHLGHAHRDEQIPAVGEVPVKGRVAPCATLSLAPVPIVYKRHYLQHGDTANVGAGTIDFDVVAEIAFSDRAAFESWSNAVGTGDNGDRVAADEARFLNRSRTRACVVRDHVTAG